MKIVYEIEKVDPFSDKYNFKPWPTFVVSKIGFYNDGTADIHGITHKKFMGMRSFLTEKEATDFVLMRKLEE